MTRELSRASLPVWGFGGQGRYGIVLMSFDDEKHEDTSVRCAIGVAKRSQKTGKSRRVDHAELTVDGVEALIVQLQVAREKMIAAGGKRGGHPQLWTPPK